MATRRLGLEKHLSRNSDFDGQINSYICRCTARLHKNRSANGILGVSGIYRSKIVGKTCVVSDVATEAYGFCYNDMLLKGPDLLVSLVTTFYGDLDNG